MLKVRTQESLNIRADYHMTDSDISKWPHLAHLDVPKADSDQIDLLTGQDNSELLVPEFHKSQGP